MPKGKVKAHSLQDSWNLALWNLKNSNHLHISLIPLWTIQWKCMCAICLGIRLLEISMKSESTPGLLNLWGTGSSWLTPPLLTVVPPLKIPYLWTSRAVGSMLTGQWHWLTPFCDQNLPLLEALNNKSCAKHMVYHDCSVINCPHSWTSFLLMKHH